MKSSCMEPLFMMLATPIVGAFVFIAGAFVFLAGVRAVGMLESYLRSIDYGL